MVWAPLNAIKKGKGSPYSITEHRVLELIPIIGSQPAGNVSHKPCGRLPLLSARPAVILATLKSCCYQFHCLVNRGEVSVSSLPKTVTRQRRGCDLNPGPTTPESSTLTTRLRLDLKIFSLLVFVKTKVAAVKVCWENSRLISR